MIMHQSLQDIVRLNIPQELYEPFWEDLYAASKSQGFNIRAIWMADVSNEGQSGIINEGILGDDRKSYIQIFLPRADRRSELV
jgi:hypothetical protein